MQFSAADFVSAQPWPTLFLIHCACLYFKIFFFPPPAHCAYVLIVGSLTNFTIAHTHEQGNSKHFDYKVSSNIINIK